MTLLFSVKSYSLGHLFLQVCFSNSKRAIPSVLSSKSIVSGNITLSVLFQRFLNESVKTSILDVC